MSSNYYAAYCWNLWCKRDTSSAHSALMWCIWWFSGARGDEFLLLYWATYLELESPVQSGLSSIFGKTRTGTVFEFFNSQKTGLQLIKTSLYRSYQFVSGSKTGLSQLWSKPVQTGCRPVFSYLFCTYLRGKTYFCLRRMLFIMMLVKVVDNFMHWEESCPLVLDHSWWRCRSVDVENLGHPCLVCFHIISVCGPHNMLIFCSNL